MRRLKEVLLQKDAVLFVGSGVSAWAGLPTWREFIERLATFVEDSGENAESVRREANAGDLLMAASYGFHKLTKAQIGEFVRQVCRYGEAKPHVIHQKLVSLGPRCFVTTNYDNLIEESLRLWQPDRFYPPATTNKQLTRLAEIVHAQGVNFVFKPHGDASDGDSIILSREQYRQLMPGGERNAALESLRTLMITRPVVYFGFGLRDPDFTYLRDLLANTYAGGPRDHYAVMADVRDEERDYWRSVYGIHLITYATVQRGDGSRDHSGLLDLLDELLLVKGPTASDARGDTKLPGAPDVVLALARHAGRLSRKSKVENEIPIAVLADRRSGQHLSHWQFDEFDNWPVARFLARGPSRALLIGLPGAGKSYSLQRAAAVLAGELNDQCLSDPFDVGAVTIPVLVDLRLYEGDLNALVNSTLPSSIELDFLSSYFKIRIFFDSFNEMPRNYWESGAYEEDFVRFAENHPNVAILIGSRTFDGLSRLQFPSYQLSQISEEFIETELKRLGLGLEGRFRAEVIQLLQQPFYFQLVASGRVSLPSDPHPRNLYESFLNTISAEFKERFRLDLDLVRPLSACAYQAIDKGEEAQPLLSVLQVLQVSLGRRSSDVKQPTDIANWLVSKLLLVPLRGERVAFFHQSATEYLAARELAEKYVADPGILAEKLRFRRWDQALFLTLSLLPEANSTAFLQEVIDTDFGLALDAVKYLEFGRDQVVKRLLREIPARIAELDPHEGNIESSLEFRLPISGIHAAELRVIMQCGDSIGSAAAGRLVELEGVSVKEEVLSSIVERRDDYNYCSHYLARALRPIFTQSDLARLLGAAEAFSDEVSLGSEGGASGFVSGLGELARELPVVVIKDAFLRGRNVEHLSTAEMVMLCEILREIRTNESLALAADMLANGFGPASTLIYFIARFAGHDAGLRWDKFSAIHVDHLMAMIASPPLSNGWPMDALKFVCAARADLSELVKGCAQSLVGIERAALLYCAGSFDTDLWFEALARLIELAPEDRMSQPLHLIEAVELDWMGRESLLVELLRTRDTTLALAIFDTVLHLDVLDDDAVPLGYLEVGPVEWLLAWIEGEQEESKRYWLAYRIARLFSGKQQGPNREAFLKEFNELGSRHRRLLAKMILPHFSGLTTDDFSEEAISFLLSELRLLGGLGIPHQSLLGNSATERFVTAHLLPALTGAGSILSANIRRILRQVGARHGQRYGVEWLGEGGDSVLF